VALNLLLGGVSSVGKIGNALTSTLGLGAGVTGASVFREDGARWSAAKQYWEKPSGTRASVQSPKPSGCPKGVACVQAMGGGPLGVGGVPVVTPKGTTAAQAVAAASGTPGTYLGIGGSGSQVNQPVKLSGSGLSPAGGSLADGLQGKTAGYVIVGGVILAMLLLVRMR
jgi:hypothetical protein